MFSVTPNRQTIAVSDTNTGAGKRKRPYGLSCLACREKKTSCDGVRPKCSGCVNTGEECNVPPPQRTLRRIPGSSSGQASTRTTTPSRKAHHTDESVQYLLDRVRRAEARMKQMEEAMNLNLGPLDALPRSPPEELRRSDTRDKDSSLDPQEDDQAGVRLDKANGSSGGVMATGAEVNGGAADGSGPRYQLSMDESGNVVYHGLTGWSEGPQYVQASPGTSASASAIPGFADPTFAPFFQALASHKHISVAPDLGDALLQCFFSYQIFETLHQPIFLRDMALNGPYFSEFLLMAVYAAATRKIDGLSMQDRAVQGELFMKLAKEYLAKDVEKRPTIPLIQGLLLLSSTQLAEGNISGGWLHAGMAFTMIIDLGIHLAPESTAGAAQLSSEEHIIRGRVFWSAFIWDKSISLALGREPTFAPRIGRQPSSIPDFDNEADAWVPFFRNPVNRPWSLANYSYQPQRRAAWFRYLARLCLILHDIIIDLYSTESRLLPRERSGFVTRTRSRLEGLWKDVPDEAKFNPMQPSPPPNVFMFQMLYHATSILLYRPVIMPRDIAQVPGQDLVVLCAEHSSKANQMAISFTSTFGERMTYVAQYSLFVAASFDIVVLGAQALDLQMAALTRLKMWMGIMDKSSNRVPSIRRSVQHITESVYRAVISNSALTSSEAGAWILVQSQPPFIPQPVQSIPSNQENFDQTADTGVFDFFDLLEPYQF